MYGRFQWCLFIVNGFHYNITNVHSLGDRTASDGAPAERFVFYSLAKTDFVEQ